MLLVNMAIENAGVRLIKDKQHGLSLFFQYRMYQIRSGTSGSPLNFRLCDTRGIEDDQGLDPHEINYFLDGNISDRHQVKIWRYLKPILQNIFKWHQCVVINRTLIRGTIHILN